MSGYRFTCRPGVWRDWVWLKLNFQWIVSWHRYKNEEKRVQGTREFDGRRAGTWKPFSEKDCLFVSPLVFIPGVTVEKKTINFCCLFLFSSGSAWFSILSAWGPSRRATWTRLQRDQESLQTVTPERCRPSQPGSPWVPPRRLGLTTPPPTVVPSPSFPSRRTKCVRCKRDRLYSASVSFQPVLRKRWWCETQQLWGRFLCCLTSKK